MPEPIRFNQQPAGEPSPESDVADTRNYRLVAIAANCAAGMVWLPRLESSPHFMQRREQLEQNMQVVFAATESASEHDGCDEKDCRWLCENLAFLHSALASLGDAQLALTRTVYVRVSGKVQPRVLALAEDLLAALDYRFSDSEFSTYLHWFQRSVVLRLDELRTMVPALRCVLLERIAGLARPMMDIEASSSCSGAGERLTLMETCIRSLREIDQAPWQELLDPQIVFDKVLSRDPAEAYTRMDAESRELYRSTVVKLARQSRLSELKIAELALSLARDSRRLREVDPLLARRRAHVGYYLIAEGQESLRQHIHVRPSFHERWQRFVRRYPDEFYLGGIEFLTLTMILAALHWGDINSLWTAFFVALLLLLPCSEGAVQIMNYLTSSLLSPQALPKLDFRDGIPSECTTMVVVPTLLLDEEQVRQLVGDLEVRYLGNMSANLHFALLTDMPDTEEQPRQDKDEAIVELCGQYIRELNEKYAGNGKGSFAMFHRQRVYNPREGVWMGWERKRGKLLDFNRLILGQYDSFPYKVGDLSVLPQVQYVLTVDADTELPRGTAQRLIGTLAHPLCRAIVDSHNVVTHGYGILQPRVAVSVESAAQSRLASIYSGNAGFDIYTHATSDVHQDLYGEGTFVGKGLYDLRTVQRVLEHRFPRDAILSHDLIEGAYARTGLVSDVELIDRYPSHYSTYTRRKHRWVRGDWQIVEWLFPRVPNEAGHRVSNPISLISRWKIVDNLRRSMVGPATLVLFILGWLALPGKPLYWTLFSLAVFLVPPWIQFAVSVTRALFARSHEQVSETFASLATALSAVLLFLAFLLHDALVSLDAIVRSSYRRAISRERLLEWETAAEAELGIRKPTPLDLYLAYSPLIAGGIAALLLLVRPRAFWVALPILVLWACGKAISFWLDRPPRQVRTSVAAPDKAFLRLAALRTWRYFAEFSTSGHQWLVPDNVQEEPSNIAARVSPTNLGLLLNARQVACEFGYLTVPEFVDQTRRTIQTMNLLPLHRGHFLNWYDTRTLSPEPPRFVSSVDSGNLAASLITLKVGCTALLGKPLLSPSLWEGYVDHLRLLDESKSLPPAASVLLRFDKSRNERKNNPSWLEHLLTFVSEPVTNVAPIPPASARAPWFVAQLALRRERVQEILTAYLPWLLPEFRAIRPLSMESTSEAIPPLAHLPAFIQQLQAKLLQDAALVEAPAEERKLRERLSAMLPAAHEQSSSLICGLHAIAAAAERWTAEMDFGFLLHPRRKLLSVGYHVDTKTLDAACYDLLASEARIAVFIAISKGDVPQDTWFRLGRAHVPTRAGGNTLISWAGTMFEYLMPGIWMRAQSNTLLQRSMQGAVRAQMDYAAAKQIPWGISEAGYAELNAGVYCYAAMGVPELALRDVAPERLVIAPYASAMALAVLPADALANLRRMAGLGWLGAYGFYEAADFGASAGVPANDPSLVRAWMAHHQGMILLSIGNVLCGNIVQQWFHSDPRVRATEILLHERPVLQHVKAVIRLAAKPVGTPQTHRRGDNLDLAS